MEQEFLGDSFCINSAGYENGNLRIDFQDGTSYTYHGVHRFVWYNLQRVVSKGWFFNKNIRTKYQWTRNS